jgi:hypothetical protein
MTNSNRDQILEMLRLADVVPFLEAFLMPPTSAIATRADLAKRWSPGGPWTDARQPVDHLRSAVIRSQGV